MNKNLILFARALLKLDLSPQTKQTQVNPEYCLNNTEIHFLGTDTLAMNRESILKKLI